MDRKDRWMVGCIVKNRWMGARMDNKQIIIIIIYI